VSGKTSFHRKQSTPSPLRSRLTWLIHVDVKALQPSWGSVVTREGFDDVDLQ